MAISYRSVLLAMAVCLVSHGALARGSQQATVVTLSLAVAEGEPGGKFLSVPVEITSFSVGVLSNKDFLKSIRQPSDPVPAFRSLDISKLIGPESPHLARFAAENKELGSVTIVVSGEASVKYVFHDVQLVGVSQSGAIGMGAGDISESLNMSFKRVEISYEVKGKPGEDVKSSSEIKEPPTDL